MDYNCIGWAAEDDSNWWWPTVDTYWPSAAPLETTVQAFTIAFGTLGYEICPDGSLETGFQKVVLYTKQGVPTHMARQLESGDWTSKLGPSYDIVHENVLSVEGSEYGDAVLFMKRITTAFDLR
jgi:hypothetical protein